MGENEIKAIINTAARNIAVALINHDEIHIATYNRDKAGRLVDTMDVVEGIAREQLEGSLIVGPGKSVEEIEELARGMSREEIEALPELPELPDELVDESTRG